MCVTLNKQTEKAACKAPSALSVSGPEWPPSLALVRRSAQSLFLAAATNYPQLWPPLQRLRNRHRRHPALPLVVACLPATLGQSTAEEAAEAAATTADTSAIYFFFLITLCPAWLGLVCLRARARATGTRIFCLVLHVTRCLLGETQHRESTGKGHCTGEVC